MGRIFIDNFDAVNLCKKKRPTYEELKAAVLDAGRFSCFEASSTPYLGNLYTRLCRDPEIEVDNEAMGYPWTVVRLRAPAKTQGGKP